MEVILVYLQPFRRNSLLKCVLQPKIVKKNHQNSSIGVQGRSKSSTFDKYKKPVTTACYDIQQVCTYLQLISHYKSQ